MSELDRPEDAEMVHSLNIIPKSIQRYELADESACSICDEDETNEHLFGNHNERQRTPVADSSIPQPHLRKPN